MARLKGTLADVAFTYVIAEAGAHEIEVERRSFERPVGRCSAIGEQASLRLLPSVGWPLELVCEVPFGARDAGPIVVRAVSTSTDR